MDVELIPIRQKESSGIRKQHIKDILKHNYDLGYIIYWVTTAVWLIQAKTSNG